MSITGTTTTFTERLIIVARAAIQAQAEQVAITADPVGGRGTFVPGTPLRNAGDATSTVAAYWAGWQLTPDQRTNLVAASRNLVKTLTVIPPGGAVSTRDTFWLFDADAALPNPWTPAQVLTALSLEPIPAAS